MAFDRFYITDKGADLLAKAQIGGKLVYTKAIAGDGELGSQLPTALTDLIHQVTELTISELDFSSPNIASVQIHFSNKEVQFPFCWREIGLFAKGDDGVEILYAYGNAADKADYIPSYGTSPTEFLFLMNVAIGNASSVTAQINTDMIYATKQDLANMKSIFTMHAADDTMHSPYAVAVNSGNDYSVTLTPAPTAYKDGMKATVKINADSTGAATININGLGKKPVYDSLGNTVTNFKANMPYQLCYESTNDRFIVLGKGGGGTAQPENVAAGMTFTNDTGTHTGTSTKKYGSGDTITDESLLKTVQGGAEVWNYYDLYNIGPVVTDLKDNIYLSYGPSSSNVNHCLVKLKSDGSLAWRRLLSTSDGANNLFMDDNDNLFGIFDDNTVKKVNTDTGDIIWSKYYTDVKYCKIGGSIDYNLCISIGAKTIRILSKVDGSEIRSFSLPSLSGSYDVCVAPDGYFYFSTATSTTATLYKISEVDGTIAWTYAPPFKTGEPSYCAVNSKGEVYLSSPNDSLVKIKTDGNVASFCWNLAFAYPSILYASDNSVYLPQTPGSSLLTRIDGSNPVAVWINPTAFNHGCVESNSGNIYAQFHPDPNYGSIRKLIRDSAYQILR